MQGGKNPLFPEKDLFWGWLSVKPAQTRRKITKSHDSGRLNPANDKSIVETVTRNQGTCPSGPSYANRQ